ncbi:hypothetical protein G6F42_024556 [Rhizopus arrhizus]|nr:hypothetical protein G6F42_024556 [Rhizopus arrhizus]
MNWATLSLICCRYVKSSRSHWSLIGITISIINPGNVTDLLSLLPAINKTWTDKGIRPKQHYSESRNGAVTQMERRAHSDRVQNLPPTTDDVDLMIEAKDKEQAVFHLYRLFDLETVDDDAWIPQTGTETKQTNGRKSNKGARKKKAAEDALKEELKEENGDDDYSEDVKPKRARKVSAKKASVSAKKRKADVDSDQEEVKLEEEEVTQVRKTTKRATAAALAKRKKIEEQVEAIELALEEKENESRQAADHVVNMDTTVLENTAEEKKPAAKRNAKKGAQEEAIAIDIPVKAPHEVKPNTRRSRRNVGSK